MLRKTRKSPIALFRTFCLQTVVSQFVVEPGPCFHTVPATLKCCLYHKCGTMCATTYVSCCWMHALRGEDSAFLRTVSRRLRGNSWEAASGSDSLQLARHKCLPLPFCTTGHAFIEPRRTLLHSLDLKDQAVNGELKFPRPSRQIRPIQSVVFQRRNGHCCLLWQQCLCFKFWTPQGQKYCSSICMSS